MNNCKVCFNFVHVFILFWIDPSLAYQAEEIIGGYTAYPPNHRYNAAIVSKYGDTNSAQLICGAGILSDYFLLSAARCFIAYNQLKKQKFRVVVGNDTLLPFRFQEKKIKTIYTFAYSQVTNGNDIAVLKLRESLNIDNHEELSFLEVPFIDENFKESSGLISGFGVDKIDLMVLQKHHNRVRLDTENGQKLKYAFVEVVNHKKCQNSYPGISNSTLLCGVIRSDMNYNHRGICVGDIGAPLVFDTRIVGIASTRRQNCDDTKHGAIYTKVLYYRYYIQALLAGNSPLHGTSAYEITI